MPPASAVPGRRSLSWVVQAPGNAGRAAYRPEVRTTATSYVDAEAAASMEATTTTLPPILKGVA